MVIKTLYQHLLRILFPKICVWCKKEGSFICNNCFKQIKLRKKRDFTLINSPIQKLYIPCLYHNNPILSRSVQAFKYNYYKDISLHLSELLSYALRNIPSNTLLVPIPLHNKREKWRGFNQAHVLAEHLCKENNLNICNLLIRSKNTTSQATLKRNQRIKNIKDAFTINSHIFPLPHPSTPIMLIDDIITTFSTMSSAAECLQKNGYTLILGTALAYAQLKHS